MSRTALIRINTEAQYEYARTRNGSLIGGAVLIGLGILFLVGQFIGGGAWRLLWPFSIIAVGGIFFAGMAAGGRSVSGLAIPGSILTMLGLLMLYQNLTGRWASWAYAWTLILIAVGLGIYIMGLRNGEPGRQRSGLRLAGIGLIFFVIFGSLFEFGAMLFGERGLGQLVFPILLIGAGLYLVAARSGLVFRGKAARDETNPPPSIGPG